MNDKDGGKGSDWNEEEEEGKNRSDKDHLSISSVSEHKTNLSYDERFAENLRL